AIGGGVILTVSPRASGERPSPLSLWGRGVGVRGARQRLPAERIRTRYILMGGTRPKAKKLDPVPLPPDQGGTTTHVDRRLPQHRHHNPQTEAGRHAIVLDLHVAFDRAAVDEGHRIEVIIGQDRDLVFRTVEEQKIAANLVAQDVRSHAAELKATHATEAASI